MTGCRHFMIPPIQSELQASITGARCCCTKMLPPKGLPFQLLYTAIWFFCLFSCYSPFNKGSITCFSFVCNLFVCHDIFTDSVMSLKKTFCKMYVTICERFCPEYSPKIFAAVLPHLTMYTFSCHSTPPEKDCCILSVGTVHPKGE